MKFIKYFTDIKLSDILLVGGKNASLGQMVSELANKGINIPLGFAVTAQAYAFFIEYNNLINPIKNQLSKLSDRIELKELQVIGSNIRKLIIDSPIPNEIIQEISDAYEWLSKYYHQDNIDVAVRSSATAEDLPNASFAGQQDSYLNIKGIESVVQAYKKCLASLFTDRAIEYRIEQKYNHFAVNISVGIQKMVRSDKASSGVMFTLDTDTGFKNTITINSSYGLGENIAKGTVNPDEFQLFKLTLEQDFKPITKKYLGSKETKLIYSENNLQATINIPVDMEDQKRFSLTDDEILNLAKQALIIEKYYSELHNSWYPMDIEWAKDGIDQKLYIVQARPETVYSHKHTDTLTRYHIKSDHKTLTIIAKGHSIGQMIAHGTARLLKNIKDSKEFQEGEILVTDMTDPDWVPIMKKAAAIVTNRGGRTCHAAIVSRELGLPAIVGTTNGTETIKDGDKITVDCSQGSAGFVYAGYIDSTVEKIKLGTIPKIPVEILLNIADPDRAYELSFLPVNGVGLARIEFIISNYVKIHPMAICKIDNIEDQSLIDSINSLAYAYANPRDFYIKKLAEGISTIAAAFYPKPVIVRLSDFKSNEYRNLMGGALFEPLEENPMIGFRGAARYCSPKFASAFALECAAIKRVREIMGLTNVKIMVPFVRTISEAQCTLESLKNNGLEQHKNNLEIIMMCEVPSNVLLLEDFAKFFDGFSIGSNDLTQLTLGADRDSALLSNLFDERDPAVKKILKMALESAKRIGSYISICGQAPSDFPEIADFLIANGIHAISLNADSVIPFFMRFKIS